MAEPFDPLVGARWPARSAAAEAHPPRPLGRPVHSVLIAIFFASGCWGCGIGTRISRMPCLELAVIVVLGDVGGQRQRPPVRASTQLAAQEPPLLLALLVVLAPDRQHVVWSPRLRRPCRGRCRQLDADDSVSPRGTRRRGSSGPGPCVRRPMGRRNRISCVHTRRTAGRTVVPSTCGAIGVGD